MKTEVKITSKEISEITGKPHEDLMKKLRKIEPDYNRFTGLNFSLSSYFNTQNKEMPMYKFSEKQIIFISSQFKEKEKNIILNYLEEKLKETPKVLETKELVEYDKSIFDNFDGKITSLEIVEMSGKNHNDLMKAIRKMEQDWVEVDGGNFTLISYNDSLNRSKPMYILSKEECLYVATKFNNKTRAKLIKRWKELEEKEKQNKPALPTTYLEALKELVVKTEENLQLKETVTIQAPKVEYHDIVLDSSTAFSTTDIAKEKGMTAVTLNKKLKELKIQYEQGNSWYLRAKYQDKGYTKTSTYTRQNSEGETVTSHSMKWTEKGRKFIHKLYNSGKLNQ